MSVKCVISLYYENGNERESVFELDEELIQKLDEIAIATNTISEELVINQTRNFIMEYGVLNG